MPPGWHANIHEFTDEERAAGARSGHVTRGIASWSPSQKRFVGYLGQHEGFVYPTGHNHAGQPNYDELIFGMERIYGIKRTITAIRHKLYSARIGIDTITSVEEPFHLKDLEQRLVVYLSTHEGFVDVDHYLREHFFRLPKLRCAIGYISRGHQDALPIRDLKRMLSH